MRIIDISLPLSSSLPVWPGDPRVVIKRTKDLDEGSMVNNSHLSLCIHSGTHLDAPFHFLKSGATVDQLPLEVLIGPAFVCFIPEVDHITASDLKRIQLPPKIKRILLRTRNSELWTKRVSEFVPDYVALTPDAAEWMVEQKIELIGIDYLSIELYGDPESRTHLILLSANVVILEGLNLAGVEPGIYQLICLPLKIPGAEGAPARAVLLEE